MDATSLWNEILPDVRRGVTGVGVWAALNSCKPVAFEDDTLVLGVPEGMSELGGHLRVPSTKRLIEAKASAKTETSVVLRIIDGINWAAWEAVKRKDVEARRMQEQAMAKMRAEIEARVSWDSVYEQLSRRYAAVSNKSLPQNRARFYDEAVALIAEARMGMTNWDDLSERNFARCLERVAQYAEVPSAIVALDVLRRAGEV
jgi:hypothetical protein